MAHRAQRAQWVVILGVDVLELRIGVPDNPRCSFVCANQERRLIERLLHSDIEPVTSAQFLQFLAAWQHVDEE